MAAETERHSADVDLEFFRHHFNPWDDRYPAQIEDALPSLHSSCPVTRSDAHDGFWVVYDYDSVVEVFQDWRAFSSVIGKSIAPVRRTQPVKPPISLDPPIQREYRRLLNPHLTPNRVAEFEPGVRQLVAELIDGFIEDGKCDLVGQFAQEFPGRMLYRFLLNIDPDEVPTVLKWTRKLSREPSAADAPEAEERWIEWIYDLIAFRRAGPRRDDLLDAVLYGEVDNRSLTDVELMGVIYILISGGFGTTADAISNAMYRMGRDLSLQARLRNHPADILPAIEEFFRYDPPVSMQSRLCIKDTVVSGHTINAGERIAVSFIGANRDSKEFEAPDVFDIDRETNRHLAFGIGVHRCVGSNLARLNLRIAIEELLARLGEFHLADGYRDAQRDATLPWGPRFLPIVFEPGRRNFA